MTNSNIQLTVSNQPVNAYLAIPASGTGPGVLVLHAWWGLKPFFKEFCDRLAQEGFIALAPDLHRGAIAQTIPEAKELMEKQDQSFTHDTVTTAKDYLLALPARKGKSIGVIGFSMGAAWSLVTAAESADQVSAVVLFYGSYSPDFSKAKAKFLGHFAEGDEWEPEEEVQMMEKNLKAAGLEATLHTYPGVAHWFMESDRPEYNPAVANQAWERTIKFLKEELA